MKKTRRKKSTLAYTIMMVAYVVIIIIFGMFIENTLPIPPSWSLELNVLGEIVYIIIRPNILINGIFVALVAIVIIKAVERNLKGDGNVLPRWGIKW